MEPVRVLILTVGYILSHGRLLIMRLRFSSVASIALTAIPVSPLQRRMFLLPPRPQRRRRGACLATPQRLHLVQLRPTAWSVVRLYWLVSRLLGTTPPQDIAGKF